MDDTIIYNFSDCFMGTASYDGANGSKISILIEGEEYMLKFPSGAPHNPKLHYSNATLSEYLGCHIFNILGVKAQETYLGTYTKGNKTYNVVACKDFTEEGKYTLFDFAGLKNRVISSSGSGYGTDLFNVLEGLEGQMLFDNSELKNHFFNILVIDALIANFDRHNGNWGYLRENATKKLIFAPIYDCGSSLYPQADTDTKQDIMNTSKELDVRINIRPLSVFKINNSKVSYLDLLSSGIDAELDNSVVQIGKRINKEFPKINQLIERSPIGENDKEFYKFILKARKERLIDISVEKVKNIPQEKRLIEFKKLYSLAH